jgi:hypothetical protein
VAGQVQGKNGQEPKKKKKKYSGQHQKEMDCNEPHLALNEKTEPIQWTERPTGALVAAGSHWTQSRSKPPLFSILASVTHVHKSQISHIPEKKTGFCHQR